MTTSETMNDDLKKKGDNLKKNYAMLDGLKQEKEDNLNKKWKTTSKKIEM
jgi:hypothetical protein